MSSSIKIGGGGKRRGRSSSKGVMLKCLAAASRRNLHCEGATSEGDSRNLGHAGGEQGQQSPSSCCELLLNKFGTTEAAVIKEIFKQRIQDRVMQRQEKQGGGSSVDWGRFWGWLGGQFSDQLSGHFSRWHSKGNFPV